MGKVNDWPWCGYYFLLGQVAFWFSYGSWLLLLLFQSAFLLLCHRTTSYHTFIYYGSGFIWALLSGYLFSPPEVQQTLSGTQVIRGEVKDIVGNVNKGMRVIFDASSINRQGVTVLRLMLYCDKDCPPLAGGETWQLLVRLKSVSGRFNPDSFDFERWMFSQSVQATASVQSSTRNRRLARSHGIAHIRQAIHQQINDHFQQPSIAASLSALLVGFRGDLTNQQRDALAQAGLSHLIAISGLHVGLAMIPGLVMGNLLWLILLPLRRIPKRKVQWLCGICCALLYALLSGMGLPAQRALIMLAVFVLARCYDTDTSSTQRIGIALLFILLLEPRAVLDMSFWLTVIVTGTIIIGMAIKPATGGNRLLYLQAFLALILSALQLYFFASYSFLSLLQNLWAIPYISLVLLPGIFIWAVVIIMPMPDHVSTWLLEHFSFWLGFLAHHFWYVLEWVNQLNQFFLWQKKVSLDIAVVLIVSLLLLWLFLRHKIALLFVTLIIMLPRLNSSNRGLDIVMFDVGQGTSILLNIEGQVLLYDTGFGNEEAAIISRILSKWSVANEISALHTYIESHEDVDHSGGTSWLIDTYPISQMISSRVLSSKHIRHHAICVSGLRWSIGPAQLEVLSPGSIRYESDNDNSCVVQIQYAGRTVLLTGDIERRVERDLLHSHPILSADVMTVPHHGSRTSSTMAFIRSVKPAIALNSSGYRNRFGFPHEEVIRRYREAGVDFYDTAQHGQIVINVTPDGEININLSRQQTPALWRRN